jgi:hypothetical protein
VPQDTGGTVTLVEGEPQAGGSVFVTEQEEEAWCDEMGTACVRAGRADAAVALWQRLIRRGDGWLAFGLGAEDEAQASASGQATGRE